MNVHERRSVELAHRAGEVWDKLESAISAGEVDHLEESWSNWERRLEEIVELGQDRPEVTIALVGGTGAGKSTLINALIEANLLPVSQMKACTSAVTEIAYSAGPSYKARITFITREDVRQEVEGLIDEVGLTEAIPEDLANDGEERKQAASMSRAAQQKLAAIFKPVDEDESQRFDFTRMELPAEIAEALDEGTRTISCDTLAAFKKEIANYLSSKGRFWPIVASARLMGPFANLEGGATLVDLPGINDPNEARELVTRKHLQSSQFVWIAIGSNRLLTKDVTELLERLAMEGRVDDLTFVATATDNVDHGDGIVEFGLDEDASKLDVIRERNKSARPEIKTRLRELAEQAAFVAGESLDCADDLTRRLTASPIYTVSAREFLRLSGLSRNAPAGMDHPEQTEIPALQRHLAEISSLHDSSALFQRLHSQIDLVLSEVSSELDARIIRLNGQIETTQRQRDDVEAALDRVETFLRPRLVAMEERLAADLAAGQELLAEKMSRAVERGQAELEQFLRRLGLMHWASLRSMMKKEGRYVGSAGEFDCSADIARPVKASVAFAYSEFFADRLKRVLTDGLDWLQRLADEHRLDLLEALAAVVGPDSTMRADLKRFAESTGKVLAEQLAQTMDQTTRKIHEVQRDLHGSIGGQVHANMVEAYRLAAQVRGTGAKARMVEIVTNHALLVSDIMFSDAAKAILDGVRGLDNWLTLQYKEMTATVARQAEHATENLRLGSVQAVPLDELEQQRESLRALDALIHDLSRPSPELAATA